MLQQMQAVIRFFMAVFYLGGGIFLIFFAKSMFQINSALLMIVGGTFLLYGIFRFYVSVTSIHKLFFKKDPDQE